MYTYIIRYAGKTLSINEVEKLSGLAAWKKRKTLEDAFTWKLIEAQVKPMASFELTLWHNAGLDMDNLATTIKPFADAMKNKPVILEDDARYWDALHILYDPKIPKGHIHFCISGPPATPEQIERMKERKAKEEKRKVQRRAKKAMKKVAKVTKRR